jgi:hypothetical protein
MGANGSTRSELSFGNLFFFCFETIGQITSIGLWGVHRICLDSLRDENSVRDEVFVRAGARPSAPEKARG